GRVRVAVRGGERLVLARERREVVVDRGPGVLLRHLADLRGSVVDGAGASAGGQAMDPAAAASSSHSVCTTPRAPTAGVRSSDTRARADGTAAASSAPAAKSQTSAADRMASNVRETRSGGGLGESCTPTV